MRTIYAPGPKAAEYSPLALNLYTGCAYGCGYCYNQKFPWFNAEKFRNPAPRPGILSALEKASARLQKIGDRREILLCFTCDPYPPPPCADITRQALSILAKYGLSVQILTKGGTRACRDFDIVARNNWSFGVTLTCMNPLASEWEPFAADPQDRMTAIRHAHAAGIFTWVSVEPVIDPGHAIAIMEQLRDCVDLWRIGKINYYPAIEAKIDWPKFITDCRRVLHGKNFMFKQSLQEAVCKCH